MKENSNFKIVKVMKFMSKTALDHLLLSIIFNDKHWRSQLDFLHLSIQHNNKGHPKNKSNLENALLLCLGLWPNNYGFSIPKYFLVLYHACTPRAYLHDTFNNCLEQQWQDAKFVENGWEHEMCKWIYCVPPIIAFDWFKSLFHPRTLTLYPPTYSTTGSSWACLSYTLLS